MAKSFLQEFTIAAPIRQLIVAMQTATVGLGKLPHINSQILYASLLSEGLGRTAEARPTLESALAAQSFARESHTVSGDTPSRSAISSIFRTAK